MSAIRFDTGITFSPAPGASAKARSLAHSFQEMLHQAAGDGRGQTRNRLGVLFPAETSATRGSRAGLQAEAESPAAMLARIGAAQTESSPKDALGNDQELDDEGMNLLQYLTARAQNKATDPTEAWLLKNHAGFIVMTFAGYQPAGLGPKEIIERYLAEMKGGNWPKA